MKINWERAAHIPASRSSEVSVDCFSLLEWEVIFIAANWEVIVYDVVFIFYFVLKRQVKNFEEVWKFLKLFKVHLKFQDFSG